MRDQSKAKTRSNNVECFLERFHTVVDGVSPDDLSDEDMDLCRFMIGGLQAK
ncbi:MAG: hypothetical protein PWR29_601 [Methanolobus sp.]|jgi:hypothetical protein|nr:hypothetical protein [Methanolobus sp.]MDK2911644.1 hypothetical protein [Methanolobus sp.]MDN5309474.1 hypothetical protein [Methanolobus sp.]